MNKENKLSKRKIESYERAEMVCQELRHQMATNENDLNKVIKYLLYWMDKTGNKVKFERPSKRIK
jgi:hypothetical protein